MAKNNVISGFIRSLVLNTSTLAPRDGWSGAVASPGFSPRGGTTNMFTKAGIHHRNVYIKKYDKLAHLIIHKMAW